GYPRERSSNMVPAKNRDAPLSNRRDPCRIPEGPTRPGPGGHRTRHPDPLPSDRQEKEEGSLFALLAFEGDGVRKNDEEKAQGAHPPPCPHRAVDSPVAGSHRYPVQPA